MKTGKKLVILDIVLFMIAGALGYFMITTPGFIFDVPGSRSVVPISDTNSLEGNAQDGDVTTRRAICTGIKESLYLFTGIANEAVANRFPKQTDDGRARGIAVLMYHKVYDPTDPPVERIDDNYISTDRLEEELKYLKSEGYSYPSWEQIRKYVDGEIDLPERSVVLTFDDGTKGFKELGVPLLEKYDIPATAFVIAGNNGTEWVKFAKKHTLIDLESHSYDMHKAGGHIGHNGIMTALSEDLIISDLQQSVAVLENGDAFAYPYGDYDPEGKCRNAVEKAGFLVGLTTVYGKVYPDADPYLLPRVRVNGSNSLETFKGLL